MFSRLETVGQFVWFALGALLALPGALRRPFALIVQCAALGLGSLPLVAAAGASIGVVSWLQANTLLADYGSQSKLPGIVAVFVVIGLGPVLTGLIVAGQVGARLGAEIGSMRITEQVDALHAMGFSPIRALVSTRVLACLLMMPLLTVTLDYVALAASFLAESLGGGSSLSAYWQGTLNYLHLPRVLLATGSSLLFGLLVGVTGCWFGLRAGEGTEGVGRASTDSVVVSMFLILFSNVIWVRAIDLYLGR